MDCKTSAYKIYHLSQKKAREEKSEEMQPNLRFILAIFKRSGKLKEGDGSTMQRICHFVLSGTEHYGAHDMIAKLHNLAKVALGRVVVQWCPGNDNNGVVQCICRSTNEWKPLLRLVVIVPRTNSFARGNVMYDRSNLCFVNA